MSAVALLLTAGAGDEPTATGLRLAERLLARGHRVTVFAHADATSVSCGDTAISRAVASLLRRGVHGATLDWVVDAPATEQLGGLARQASGVVGGDHADLWAFVRGADVVLAPPAGGEP